MLSGSSRFGDHGLVTVNDPDARITFDRKVHALEGLRIRAVDYWDIHTYGPKPARWDYSDWHHAVMGVQLSTDAGRSSRNEKLIGWIPTGGPPGRGT
ncbi:hypothetical protein GCM10009743_64290 [Kribbella swartbergensis]